MPDSYSIAVVPGDGTGRRLFGRERRCLKQPHPSTVFRSISLNTISAARDISGQARSSPTPSWKNFVARKPYIWAPSGTPRLPRHIGEGYLLRLRFELDLYVNLRPVKLYPCVDTPLKDKGPEHVDFVVVREYEGFYVGPEACSRRAHQTR